MTTSRTPGILRVFLIRIDNVAKHGLERTDRYITSSRRAEDGDIADAAIFRSRDSAEKAIRQIHRHLIEHIPGFKAGKRKLYVEEHEIESDTDPYVPYG